MLCDWIWLIIIAQKRHIIKFCSNESLILCGFFCRRWYEATKENAEWRNGVWRMWEFDVWGGVIAYGSVPSPLPSSTPACLVPLGDLWGYTDWAWIDRWWQGRQAVTIVTVPYSASYGPLSPLPVMMTTHLLHCREDGSIILPFIQFHFFLFHASISEGEGGNRN